MKGTVRNGEKFIDFDVNEVNYSGSVYTYVDIPEDRASKEDLMRARLSGMIERWAEHTSCYEIQVESDKIEWED